MKLMINIPGEAYELLKGKSELDNIAESIIANGTPISTEGDLISRSELKKAYFKAINETSIGEVSIIDLIDNAPTVLTYSEEDMCNATSGGYDIGYDMARRLYERSQVKLANEVWKLYEKYQPYLATRVIEFGDELKELLGKYQEGGKEE